MEFYSEKLKRECSEIEQTSPEIKKIVDDILRIDRISSFEFDYQIERKIMMYNSVKKILSSELITFCNFLFTEMKYTTETDYTPEEQVDVYLENKHFKK